MKPVIPVVAAIMLTSAGIRAANPISLEQKLEQAGYVDVTTIDPSIKVSLMYARSDNFVGAIMYTDLHKAYLHPEAAEAVVKAQQELHKIHPDYNLKICDASRPMSVQKRMYEKVKGTPQAPYVSNPARGPHADRRVALVAQGARRHGTAHRYRHGTLLLIHPLQPLLRGVRQERHDARRPGRVDPQPDLSGHRRIPLPQSAQMI